MAAARALPSPKADRRGRQAMQNASVFKGRRRGRATKFPHYGDKPNLVDAQMGNNEGSKAFEKKFLTESLVKVAE